MSHFYTPWKREKTKGFLKFFFFGGGGIEWDIGMKRVNTMVINWLIAFQKVYLVCKLEISLGFDFLTFQVVSLKYLL